VTIKTPEEIADEYVDTITWPYGELTTISATALADMLTAAIEADRAQRFNAADMEVLFDIAESGIAREVGAIDVRHQYANGEIERMKRRWSGARAAIAALREVLA
jgi:hypothetical protein